MTATAEEFVAGLRDLADFIEQHDELAYDFTPTGMRIGWAYGDHAKEQMTAYARAFGTATKEYSGGFFKISHSFGPITVYAATTRNNVCRKVVKGTKLVTRQNSYPNTPMVTIIEEVDDVEWVCDEPLLAATRSEAAA